MDYISNELAQEIAETTSRILGYNVIITDCKGIVIGAMDRSRLGTFHQASLQVVQTNRPHSYVQEEAAKLKGVLPGMAAPITLNNSLIGVLGIAGDPEQLEKYTALVRNQVEMMCQQALLLEIAQLKSRAIESYILEIVSLDQTSKDSNLILTRGSVLGFDMQLPRVTLVVDICSFNKLTSSLLNKTHGNLQDEIQIQHLKNKVLSLLQKSLKSNPQDIVTFLTEDKYIILKTISLNHPESLVRAQLKDLCLEIIQSLKQNLQLEVAVGIGSYHPKIEGIALSYKEALNALYIGRNEDSIEKVWHIKDLVIGHALASIKTSPSKVYLSEILERMQRSRQYQELKETILALCKNNLNMNDTAKHLYIHRNTLIRRLEKIKDITGLNPKIFNDIVQLFLSIRLGEMDR